MTNKTASRIPIAHHCRRSGDEKERNNASVIPIPFTGNCIKTCNDVQRNYPFKLFFEALLGNLWTFFLNDHLCVMASLDMTQI